jgi:phosphatidylglycerol lysyltransferase
MSDLRAVSDNWLAAKSTREKCFSVGFFDENYLGRFSQATVRVQGQICAFANLIAGEDKEELSIDLMRYSNDAPSGTMDFLFIHLMLWGREHGYRWFNLGMAPLSGLEDRPLAPVWNRVSALVYRHGEHFYNFQGLRKYKQKFSPQWQAKYLVSPGGLALPTILTNLASVISRGLSGVVLK